MTQNFRYIFNRSWYTPIPEALKVTGHQHVLVPLQLIFTMLLLLCGISRKIIYKDAAAPIESSIKDLVSKMNVDEKILQLNQSTYGINNNVYKIGEEIKSTPLGIGSLIYLTFELLD